MVRDLDPRRRFDGVERICLERLWKFTTEARVPACWRSILLECRSAAGARVQSVYEDRALIGFPSAHFSTGRPVLNRRRALS